MQLIIIILQYQYCVTKVSKDFILSNKHVDYNILLINLFAVLSMILPEIKFSSLFNLKNKFLGFISKIITK